MIARFFFTFPYQIFVILYVAFETVRNKKQFRSTIIDRIFLKSGKDKSATWIHSASVGEFRGILPLVKLLQIEFPDMKFIFTTTSSTGLKEVRKTYPNFFSSLLPLDLAPLMSKFICENDPRLLIVNETEIWPQLYTQANKFSLPIVLVNGRISDKVYPSYKRFGFLFHQLVKGIKFISAQTDLDKDRFISLGAREQNVKVLGSTKFDTSIEELPAEVSNFYVKVVQGDDQVFTFGSVREEEEEIVIEAINQILKEIPLITIFVVPRYVERFLPFYQKLQKINVPCVLRSEIDVHDRENACRIILVDKIGELLSVYNVSSLAFVGGTYSSVGGHNILEPAYFKVPVVIGPRIETQRLAFEALRSVSAIKVVENSLQLGSNIVELLKDKKELESLGLRGYEVNISLKGASDRLLLTLWSFF